MQKGDELARAPIAAEQYALAQKVQRPSNTTPGAFRQNEYDLLTHAFAHVREERAREVRPAPFSAAGVHVEGEEGVPMRFRDIAPAKPLEFHPFVEYRRAFLAQRLALGRRQVREEILEAGVTAVVPMEL